MSPGWIAGAGAGVMVVAMAALWLTFKLRMRYVVGRTSVRVMVGNLTLRRIELSDIERVAKPRRDLTWTETENWRNCFRSSHRLLVLHRKSGWFRKFVITPRHRYEFRAELRAVLEKMTGRAAAEEFDAGDDE
jgi:hypothetical protein